MTRRPRPPDDATPDRTDPAAIDADPDPDADVDADADVFEPFANDSQVMTFADGRGELSIENGTESLLLHGDLEFAATPDCLARVRALRAALERIEAEISTRLASGPADRAS